MDADKKDNVQKIKIEVDMGVTFWALLIIWIILGLILLYWVVALHGLPSASP